MPGSTGGACVLWPGVCGWSRRHHVPHIHRVSREDCASPTDIMDGTPYNPPGNCSVCVFLCPVDPATTRSPTRPCTPRPLRPPPPPPPTTRPRPALSPTSPPPSPRRPFPWRQREPTAGRRPQPQGATSSREAMCWEEEEEWVEEEEEGRTTPAPTPELHLLR